MKLPLLVLLAPLVFLAPITCAETWNCTNKDMEVACSEGECAAIIGYGFTPMDVAFNDSGSLLVCAYSGCWEGEGDVFRSGSFLSISGSDLGFSTDPDPERKQDVAILLDLDDNVALLKSGVFAQPLICVSIDDSTAM